jgi:hypothetical protein
MSRAPGKYVAGTMAPAGAALDRPAVVSQTEGKDLQSTYSTKYVSFIELLPMTCF